MKKKPISKELQDAYEKLTIAIKKVRKEDKLTPISLTLNSNQNGRQ